MAHEAQDGIEQRISGMPLALRSVVKGAEERAMKSEAYVYEAFRERHPNGFWDPEHGFDATSRLMIGIWSEIAMESTCARENCK